MLKQNEAKFVDSVTNELVAQAKHNKVTLEKLAIKFGIQDKNNVKELIELAIVLRARFLAHEPNKSIQQKFAAIVDLYNNQVNLSHRTSQSILLQQYSTPAPIAFLMGVFCGIEQKGNYFEPSAGNGLLTIAGDPQNFIVNEIEDFRNHNLKSQGYKEVWQMDGSIKMPWSNQFDAIITNPPFGKTKPLKFGEFTITDLDHVMAIRALDTMQNKGKAAIIIGGHTTWDDKGRIQAGKNRSFFSYLYSHYNVLDVILIDGHKLYSRQGTAFNTRLILIDSRKPQVSGFAPLFDKTKDYPVTSFNELYDRIIKFESHEDNSDLDLLELEAEAIEIELALLSFDRLNGYVQTEVLKVKSRYKHSVSSSLLKQFYKDNLVGTFVKNLETGITIEFKKAGLDKSIFGRKNSALRVIQLDNILATAIHYLPELLKFAVFVKHSTRIKPNHLKLGGKLWWNFLSKLNVDGTTYYLIIPVLETAKGKFQYSIEHAIIKKSISELQAKK